MQNMLKRERRIVREVGRVGGADKRNRVKCATWNRESKGVFHFIHELG